jgi:hypothetical protein
LTCQKLAKQEAAVWMSGAKAIDVAYPGAFAHAEKEMLKAGKAQLTDLQARNVAFHYMDSCLSPEGMRAVRAQGFSSTAYAQHMDRLAFVHLVQQISFGCNYRLNQQVISFDPVVSEMLELDQGRKDELVSDDGAPLPTDLLSRLPFETFVVVPNYGDVLSFLVECIKRKIEGQDALFLNIIARVPDTDTGEVHQVPASSVLRPGLNLAETIMGTNRLLEERIGQSGRAVSPSEEQRTFSVLAHVLPYLLYLCAENRELDGDVDAQPQLTKTRKGPRVFARQTPNLMQAGIRIGSAIRDVRRARAEQDGSESGSGFGRLPHLRIAHWHMYWKGPRNDQSKRSRVLHFLPPIPVNVQKPGDLQPVVRPAGVIN